jgi:hypothetical protein
MLMATGRAAMTASTDARFARVWAEAFGLQWEPLGSYEDAGVLYGESSRLGLRNYFLAPRGLYWGPGSGDDPGGSALVECALDHCLARRTVALTWNFRYDSESRLDVVRRKLGEDRCRVEEGHTHVVDVHGRCLEDVLANQVKGVTRRQVRGARERGVTVAPLATDEQFEAHADMYAGWASHKGVEPYPRDLFRRLAHELGDGAPLLGAFDEEGRVVAACQFLCDGDEWFYWHAVRDPALDRHFGMDALLAHGIELACSAEARYVNLGGSSGIESLEFFKGRWGASPRPVWSLGWESRVWSRIVAGWRRVR